MGAAKHWLAKAFERAREGLWPPRSELGLAEKSEAILLASLALKRAHDLRGDPNPARLLERDLRSLALRTSAGNWLRQMTLHAIGAKEALSAAPALFRGVDLAELTALSEQLKRGEALSCKIPALSAWAEALNRARDAGMACWPNAVSLAFSERRELEAELAAEAAPQKGARRL